MVCHMILHQCTYPPETLAADRHRLALDGLAGEEADDADDDTRRVDRKLLSQTVDNIDHL